MSSDPIWPSIVILFVLLLFYALCTACSAAVEALGESARNRLAERDDRNAVRLVDILDQPDNFQSALHLAELAAETAWFVYGSHRFYTLFPLSAGRAVLVSAVILAALLWLFGRMLPRQAALGNPEGTALVLCGPFRAVTVLLTPLTALFLLLAKGLLFVFRVSPKRVQDDVSEDEIRAMVDMGQESGLIEDDEKQMIENVFEFNNMTAEDVMIHRTNMEMIPLDASKEEVLARIESTGLSRFPVYRDDADDIVGILSTRVYLLNLQKAEPLPMSGLLREAYFVPESVRTDLLFHDMQSRSLQMAIVVDEYGGTSGLVTLEDLLEELVGNIYDEFDPKDTQEIIPLTDRIWRVAGTTDLDLLAEVIGIEIPEEERADTLGGLVFSHLSVIPEDGATPTVQALGLLIQVEVLSDRRVEWALVSKRAEPEEDGDAAD